MHSKPCLLAALSLAAAAAAQNSSSGMFPGIPAAIGVAPGGGFSPMQMLFKDHGFQSAAPSVQPGFDLQMVLQQFNGPATLVVDDFSLGLDWVLADDNTGQVHVPATQWAAVTFSVTAASVGAPGSKIAAEAASRGGVGGDLFSYVLPGSALPAAAVGSVDRVHDSSEMGLAASADVSALDHFAPMHTLEPALRAMLPNVTIFFTVPNSSVALVPGFWWSNSPTSAAAIRSGATILAVSRFGATWRPPQPFMTWRDLGLQQGDDIDGLAVDLEDQRILFSLRQPTTRSQLMFLYYGTDQAVPVPYTEPGGASQVSTSVGVVQTDDIDAICSMDPSVRQHGGTPNAFYYFMGYWRSQVLPPTPSIGASAFRDYIGGNTVYTTYMYGYPPLTGPGPGVAALFLTFGNSLVIYPLGGLQLRSPAPLFVGDPKRYGLTVPAVLSLTGVDVTFRWFAADAGATELAEAWPVRVRL